MKTRFTFLLAVLTVCQVVLAEDHHISVTDQASWSTELLRPYLEQTVVFDMPLVVSAISGNTMTVGPWRRFQAENQGEAGSDEYVQTMRINNNLLTLEDVPGNHRMGERVYGMRATVDSKSPNKLSWQSGGKWKGNSRSELEALNLRRAVGINDDCDSCLLVCGFNVENYFVAHLGSQYLGANTLEQHKAQRAKVSAALKKINADIFGFCELEQGDAAIGEIVEDLRSNTGRNYQFFSNPNPNGTNQKSDFVYDADKVEPLRTPASTDVEVSDRKKMIAFRQISNGEKFIFSINHFKAMNTGAQDRREKESRAVIDLYNRYRQRDYVRDNDVLIMGDLNSYGKASPILIFTRNGLIDLHRSFHADSSYSYVYGGQAAYIDHAICNESIFRQITGMMAFHINSDEPSSNSYSRGGDNTMFRCSDHDPILVGLRLDSTLSKLYDPYLSSVDFNADSLTFYYTSTTGQPHMYFDIYSIDGHQIVPPTNIDFDGEIAATHTHYYTVSRESTNLPAEFKQFLPLPAGIYIIHFYYNGMVKAHKLIVR